MKPKRIIAGMAALLAIPPRRASLPDVVPYCIIVPEEVPCLLCTRDIIIVYPSALNLKPHNNPGKSIWKREYG
tara:strand:- start:2605 stop:2823 length:219 start_codon:yes stop_codon:yes gene_type:complete